MNRVVEVNSQGVVPVNKLSLMRCIEIFESGEPAIFLADEHGRYNWKGVERSVCQFMRDERGNWLLHFNPIPPVVFPLPINVENRQALSEVLDAAFKLTPQASALPVLQADGRVVAVAKKTADPGPPPEWRNVAGVRHGLPRGKLYLASDAGQMSDLMSVLQDVVEIEVLTDVTVATVLNGETDGTLIYSADIYPPDIPKLSIAELYQRLLVGKRFEKNKTALEKYEGFHGKFGDLSDVDTQFTEKPPIESRVKEFLEQIESDKPILLQDAYCIKELIWMCDRLRTSNRYGEDNRLYLRYSSWGTFLSSMENLDWSELISTKKVVILFTKSDYLKFYPSGSRKSKTQSLPLEVNEINEIFHTSSYYIWSGNGFMNMIFDFHPYLLTVWRFALTPFGEIYNCFLKDCNAKTAIYHMENPRDEFEKKILSNNVDACLRADKFDGYNSLEEKIDTRRKKFYKTIKVLFEEDYVPIAREWLIAFYIAADTALDRKFPFRIAPAIFYDRHHDAFCTDRKSLQSSAILTNGIMGSFKYRKIITITRNPLVRFASEMETRCKWKTVSPYKTPLDLVYSYLKMKYTSYIRIDSSLRDIWRIVRFEDLKLYPKYTLSKICEFIRIPFNESLLKCTTNGEENEEFYGTKGFDITPVYNEHKKCFSTLDAYRYELIKNTDHEIYGYKLRHKPYVDMSKEDVEKLFSLPWACEDAWGTPENKEAARNKIIELAIQIKTQGYPQIPVDAKGRELVPVEWLRPDIPEGEKLYE